MEPARTIDIIRRHSDEVRDHRATALYVFGSQARGDADASSDLDVLVDYEPGSGFVLIDLVRIKRLLERLTGLPTDVTTRDSLRPETRAEIEGDAVRVF